jgi:hypothetical protein
MYRAPRFMQILTDQNCAYQLFGPRLLPVERGYGQRHEYKEQQYVHTASYTGPSDVGVWCTVAAVSARQRSDP